MKFCLRSRCGSAYLARADEIKVDWRDRSTIMDLAVKYTEATFILQFTPSQIQPDEIIDFNELKNYNTVCEGRFICCVHDQALIPIIRNMDIKCYWGYPVDSLWELQGLKALGVCYARLGVSLFFQLDKVAAIGVPIRAVPNLAYTDSLPHENGICGQWIRPEDTEAYETYVSVFEFEDADIKKEQALYRVYSADGWYADLKDLITNLNYSASSHLIPPEFAKRRMTCGHRCQAGGSCHYCPLIMSIANKETASKIVEASKRS